MSDANTMWGEVRSWAHGTYSDDLDKLSMLESIFERSTVPAGQVEGLVEYLREQLAPYAPRSPEPRNSEVMRAWLSGQLGHTLGFMLPPDEDVFGYYDRLDTYKGLRSVEAYLRRPKREQSGAGHPVRVCGSVGREARNDVCSFVARELGNRRVHMRKARSDGSPYPGEEDWQACLEDGFYWKKRIYQYTFHIHGITTNHGLSGGYDVVVYIRRKDTLVEVRGPRYNEDTMALFELLAQLMFRFPTYSPEFDVAGAWEGFAASWGCYRAIRLGR